MPNRWTHAGKKPGSVFHELVVLPTTAPELARPEYIDRNPCPGSIILPQPRSQQLQNGVMLVHSQYPPGSPMPLEDDRPTTPSPDVEMESLSDDDTSDLPRKFCLMVTLERQVVTYNHRGIPEKRKPTPECRTGPSLAILDLSRSKFIEEVYRVHSLQERYGVSNFQGPPLRATCKGMTGGAQGAPTIRDDGDWDNWKAQPALQKADTVHVFLLLNDLEPFRNLKQPLSPDPMEEVTKEKPGQPSLANYTNAERGLAAKIEDIKIAWACEVHDQASCYFAEESSSGEETVHVTMNRYRLKQWATNIMAHNLEVSAPPPTWLVSLWVERDALPSVLLPVPKPRGTQGPVRAAPLAVSETSSDLHRLLSSVAGPALQSFTDLALSTLRASMSSSSSSHDNRLSSLPPLDNQLDLNQKTEHISLDNFMKAFAKHRRLPDDVPIIISATEALDLECYSPDIIGESTAERLKELTGLPEGHVLSLRKFAASWNNKVPHKRARHSV